MCLRVSKTPFVILLVAVYMEMSVRNGICDDRKLSSQAVKRSQSRAYRADNWKGWDDWVSTSASSHNPYFLEDEDESHFYNPEHFHIPLSHKENKKKRVRVTATATEIASTNAKKGKSQKTDKTAPASLDEDSLSFADLINLKNAAVSLASTISNQFTDRLTSFSSSFKNELDPVRRRRNREVTYLDNLDRQDGPNFGKPERDAKRGVIDWLSRLIGVQGKTLGEFLREYQVHVLYDLAFTFFKWIFFLYAGLLIP